MNYELEILTALTLACEGTLELNRHGLRRATVDDALHVTVEYEDGRLVPAEQVEARLLQEVIQCWREEHPAFFQRILGAMM